MADGLPPPPPPGFTLDPHPVYGAAPKPESPPTGYAPQGKPVTPLAPVPGGPADPTRIQPDPGYHLMPDGSEVPNKGGPHDPTNPESSLTPEALDDTTSKLILTGQMDPMGMGGGPVRLQILNNRPVMLQKYGITDQQLPSIQTQFKADSTAYSQRVQQLSFIQQAADAANQHIHQITGYLQQLPAQTDARALNAISNFAQRQMSGDTISQLDTTIPLLKAEMAKIMTANPSGAAQLTDDARHEFDILESNVSPHAKLLALQALQQMGVGKINGLKTEIDGLHGRLTGGLQTYAQLAHGGLIGGPGGPGTPPPGSTGPTPPAPNLPPDQHTPATGGSKEVYDPSMTPVRQEYMARLQAGQSGTQLIGFLRKAGLTDTALLKSAADQAAFRRQHPDIPINAYNTAAIDHHVQQMGVVNRAVNAVGQTDVGAGAIAAGNAVLGGFGPDLVGAVGGNEEQARLAGQYSAQDHPASALAGSIAGGTAAALAGEGLLGAGGMGAGFGRSLLADTGYGTAAGAGSNPDNRTAGAIEGGLAGAAGSMVGQGLAKGTSAALRGVTNADVGTLAANGVNSLTPGQIVANSGRAGQFVKGVEDRLSGFAGPGTMINARRAEGVRQFNSAAFDQALKPIGGSVKGAVGEDAMSAASDQVGQAFNSALKGKSAVPDAEFINQARGPLERLAANKRIGPEIVDSIEQATQGLFDEKTGALAGEHMQAFLQALRQIKQGFRNDPAYQTTIKPSIQGLENAVEGMFQRQAPEVMPAFNQAKAAYRRVSILADAVDKGKSTEGVFTPAQLGMADRANAKKFDGKISSASGKSPFFDLQRAAQNVLPSKVPDSGTAGRLALVGGAGLTSLGAGAGYLGGDAKGGAETGLGLTALLAAAYTRAGNRRLAQLLLSRSPAARALAEKIAARAPIAGAAATTLMLPSNH